MLTCIVLNSRRFTKAVVAGCTLQGCNKASSGQRIGLIKCQIASQLADGLLSWTSTSCLLSLQPAHQRLSCTPPVSQAISKDDTAVRHRLIGIRFILPALGISSLRCWTPLFLLLAGQLRPGSIGCIGSAWLSHPTEPSAQALSYVISFSNDTNAGCATPVPSSGRFHQYTCHYGLFVAAHLHTFASEAGIADQPTPVQETRACSPLWMSTRLRFCICKVTRHIPALGK